MQVDNIIEAFLSRSSAISEAPSDAASKVSTKIPFVVNTPFPPDVKRPTEPSVLHLKEPLSKTENLDGAFDNISKEDRQLLAGVGRYFEMKGVHGNDALDTLKSLLPDNCTMNTEQILDNITHASIVEEMDNLQKIITIIGAPLGVTCDTTQLNYYALSPEHKQYQHEEAFKLVKKHGWHHFVTDHFIPNYVKVHDNLQSKLGLALVYTVCRMKHIFSMTSGSLLQHAQSNYFFHILVKETLPHLKYILKQLFCHLQKGDDIPTDGPPLAGIDMMTFCVSDDQYTNITKVVRTLCCHCIHIDGEYSVLTRDDRCSSRNIRQHNPKVIQPSR